MRPSFCFSLFYSHIHRYRYSHTYFQGSGVFNCISSWFHSSYLKPWVLKQDIFPWIPIIMVYLTKKKKSVYFKAYMNSVLFVKNFHFLTNILFFLNTYTYVYVCMYSWSVLKTQEFFITRPVFHFLTFFPFMPWHQGSSDINLVLKDTIFFLPI